MFGLEKQKDEPFFTFDLEKEMQNPEKQAATVKRVESHIQEIKQTLRNGAKSKEFEDLGFLLHGYSALLKVLTKIQEK